LDYERYYEQAIACHREIKEKTDFETKTVKRIQQCVIDGDLNAVSRHISGIRASALEREDALKKLEEITESFDGKVYMSDGDYVAQMLEYCKQLGVDTYGSYPAYEMFPCRVTINADTQDVAIDKKRLACLRPGRLVTLIKTELDRLAKMPFNAGAFAKELANAYDLALLKKSKGKAYDATGPCYLEDLYNYLTPMRWHKRDYTKNNYAFDLARLYASEDLTLSDGRRFRFDTVRENKKAIRILDQYNSEQYIATIRLR
jgi:ADP-ribose pyrophosphatase YjhB (NUDIX family)